jgi:hypothetical protein
MHVSLCSKSSILFAVVDQDQAEGGEKRTRRRDCSDGLAMIEWQVFEWKERQDVSRYRATEKAKRDKRQGEQVT